MIFHISWIFLKDSEFINNGHIQNYSFSMMGSLPLHVFTLTANRYLHKDYLQDSYFETVFERRKKAFLFLLPKKIPFFPVQGQQGAKRSPLLAQKESRGCCNARCFQVCLAVTTWEQHSTPSQRKPTGIHVLAWVVFLSCRKYIPCHLAVSRHKLGLGVSLLAFSSLWSFFFPPQAVCLKLNHLCK